MKPLKPFRDEDERHDAQWKGRSLDSAARYLDGIRRDPNLAEYLDPEAAQDLPAMPSATDIIKARETLEQAMQCLAHVYDRRRDPMWDNPADWSREDPSDDQPF
jgi:hypothetical protein